MEKGRSWTSGTVEEKGSGTAGRWRRVLGQRTVEKERSWTNSIENGSRTMNEKGVGQWDDAGVDQWDSIEKSSETYTL